MKTLAFIRFLCGVFVTCCAVVLAAVWTGCTAAPDGTIDEAAAYAALVFVGGFMLWALYYVMRPHGPTEGR